MTVSFPLHSQFSVSALVDSGSPASFVNQHVGRILQVSPRLCGESCFAAVNDSAFISIGKISLSIVVLGRLSTVEFHVTNALFGYDMILGRDFLCDGNYCLRFTGHRCSLEQIATTAAVSTAPNPLSGMTSVSESFVTHSTQPEHSDATVMVHQTSNFLTFGLQGEQGIKLQAVIHSLAAAFSQDNNDIGRTTLATHRIVTEGPPIRGYNYKPPHHLHGLIQQEIDTMFRNGIIEKSESPYSSPILLVPKPDGGKRFCVSTA